MEVGIRELRDGLSRHLAEVKAGHTIHVTDHGKVIAKIVPVGVPTTLERLRLEGRITPAKRRKTSHEPVETDGPVSDLIDDQRR